MSKTRTVRDPIHGFVELSAVEWDIVNSAAFQRLRDVRQLGMGHLVYPGANHTRFEHSIGCVHVASRMYDRLWDDLDSRAKWTGLLGPNAVNRHAELRQVVRLAALLHDVGHAPFSHAGEDLFVPEGVDLDAMEEAKRAATLKRYSHEHSTVELIRSEELDKILRTHGVNPVDVIWVATEPSRAAADDLFNHPELDVLNQLLTGELGADRCDYLMRDAYHSGQPAGSFDLERLIHQTMIVQHEGVDYLGLKEGGAIAAEQMVANRYAAYVNLYFHKAKRAYEQHLVQFMKAWLPGGRLPAKPSDFVGLSDSHVWAAICSAARSSGDPAHRVAVPLATRNHFRVAFERVPADLKTRSGVGGAGLVQPEGWKEFVENVRKKFGQDAFVDVCSHSATKLRQRQHRVMVQMSNRVRSLDTLSEIVGGMEERIWRLRVHSVDVRRLDVQTFCANLWNKLSLAGGGT